MSDDRTVRAPGRPRDAATGAAILDAALQQLAAVGYDRLTIGAVATRSGAAKTTIYRRWPDKAALVAAAVARRALTLETATATASGDLRSTALAIVTDLAHQMARQDLGLLTALFAARRSDPALAQDMHHMLRQDAATMTAPLAPAAERTGVALGHPDDVDDRAIDYLVDRLLLPLIIEV